MNKKRKKLLDVYRQAKKDDDPVQLCAVCKERSPKAEMEPHHTNGRRGPDLLCYLWLHPLCHRWVHDNPKKAEERELLIKGRNRS